MYGKQSALQYGISAHLYCREIEMGEFIEMGKARVLWRGIKVVFDIGS